MSEKLGRYRLLSLLATGGMGEVFVARQEGPAGFAKTVVVKRILRHLAGDQGFIDLFLNEARLAAQLQHPNIAQVFGLEQEDDTWFIAMEYVHGRSLRAIIDEAKKKALPIPPRIAVRICSQALQGLQFAHGLTDGLGRPLGILHRDVSPENILVGFSGVVKLVDFGIAKAMSRGDVTRVGRPKGKLAYMAPELTVSGATIDRRVDVYGMGVVLCEALTLARPPNAPTTPEELEKPREPYPRNAALPKELDEVISRALAPQPAERWETANAMSEALEQYLLASQQTVLPSDVSAYLEALFGRDVAGANPAVMPMDLGVGRTDQMPAMATTGPVRTDLVAALAAGVHHTEQELRAISMPAPGQPAAGPPKSQGWVIGGIGVATAVIFLGITIVGVVGTARAGHLPDAGGILMPELSFLSDDGGMSVEVDGGARIVAVKRPFVRRPVPKVGRIVVRVNPWAEVFVGAKSYGVTPIGAIELPAGTATLTLKNSQLGAVRKVTVKVLPGQTTVIKADLFKK